MAKPQRPGISAGALDKEVMSWPTSSPSDGPGACGHPKALRRSGSPAPPGLARPCAALSRQTRVALSHSALGTNYAAMENGNKCFLLFVAFMWSQISRISQRTENSEHILLPPAAACPGS